MRHDAKSIKVEGVMVVRHDAKSVKVEGVMVVRHDAKGGGCDGRECDGGEW